MEKHFTTDTLTQYFEKVLPLNDPYDFEVTKKDQQKHVID